MAVTTPAAFYLDAASWAAALRSGIHRVMLEQDTLNRINVFPVADGDTGTNMSLSLGVALDTLARCRRPGEHLGSLSTSVADILLDGARGNSGAIIAQFFQGVSDTAEDLSGFDAANLVCAVKTGTAYAHDALAKPRQGTILSVMAAFSDYLAEHHNSGADSAFADTMMRATVAAKQALAKTTDQIAELKKANVVDAGASAFVTLVEGMTDYIVHGRFTDRPAGADGVAAGYSPAQAAGDDLPVFRFCTECLVTGDDIDRRKLREDLAALGDSLVIAGTKRKAKIHLHVDEPEAVFAVARRYGELAGLKADDMEQQQRTVQGQSRSFAVITDSAADIADEEMERLDIHMVPCRVQIGERSFLDKVSITAHEFFAELAASPVAATTSQPSPGDFRRQFQHLASHFPDVVSINLTPTVSGTWQAARSAAERTGAAGRVHVVDSRNASLGQGQIAVFAAECAAAGLGIETALKAIDEMVAATTSFALIRDLSHAVRGGRVPRLQKRVADWLRLTPVIRTTADGRIATGGMLPGRRQLLPKFARFIARQYDRRACLHLAFGHAVCEEDAHALRELLLQLLPNVQKTTMTVLGSALGAHGGPGSLVVAVQAYREPASFAAATTAT